MYDAVACYCASVQRKTVKAHHMVGWIALCDDNEEVYVESQHA